MHPHTIASTIEKWTEDPASARSTPTVVARSDGSEAVIEAGPFTWRADLPPGIGGGNAAPSPTAMLLGALAGCAVVFVRDTLAPQLGITVDAVEATVRCAADGRGLLAMDGVRPDLTDFALEVVVDSPDGPEAVQRIADVWQQRCPIYLALVNPNDVGVTFRSR
jgi:uncharacterized OsmC-like protein